MTRSVLIVGPPRPTHEVFNPLWSELQVETHRFTSAEAALEIMSAGEPPTVVLVSYPLWDTNVEDLLAAMERLLGAASAVPTIVLAPPDPQFEVAALEDRGVRVLSEGTAPEELRRILRDHFGRSQRAHPRFIVRMEVRVGTGALLRACQSEDISLSGMLLRTSEEFPVGSAVKLEIGLPNDQDPIRCEASVVRYTDPVVEEVRGMGVHFLAFADNDRERLARFLED